MHYFIKKYSFVIVLLTVIYFVSFCINPAEIEAQELSKQLIPLTHSINSPSSSVYYPVVLSGIEIISDKPFQFNFTIDTGNAVFQEDQLK